MQVSQQTQPLPLNPHLKSTFSIGLYTTVLIVSAIAGPIIGITTLTAFNFGLVVYLKDRWVTRWYATALTCIIISISLSILLPPSTLIAAPLIALTSALSIFYATEVHLNK